MEARFNLLGVQVSAINLDRAWEVVSSWISSNEKHYVCVAPVSTIVDCQRDSQYKQIVNEASMVTPDGMPVVWMGRLKGYKQVSRTYGPDLMRKVCSLGQSKRIKHFFYGGTDKGNIQLIQKLKEQYPEIEIAGSYAPGEVEINALEEASVLQTINEAGADIMWVGLGSPKQDYWMSNHRDKVQVPVLVGVGAAFDFLAGLKRQAPAWMQRSGLEWFYRLCSEPGRLWKRYLVGNSLFIYYIIIESLFGNRK